VVLRRHRYFKHDRFCAPVEPLRCSFSLNILLLYTRLFEHAIVKQTVIEDGYLATIKYFVDPAIIALTPFIGIYVAQFSALSESFD
jgi:hypothetical protein